MNEQLFEMKINYPPTFKPRYGRGSPLAKHIATIFQEKEKEQLNFLSTIQRYKSELSKINTDSDENSSEPRWNQPWFPPLDGMSMYAMIASNQPNTYLEIGSGNSTKFASRAIKDNSLNTTIISVDPQPRSEVNSICDKVIRKRLEEATELADIICRLEPNDVVFFDGSHRCLQNSDVTAFFIDYLPSIPDGVKIGIHDIFWPADYPKAWVERYYNEQYVLGAYMLGQGSRFPLVFSCVYMNHSFSRSIEKCLDPSTLEDILEKSGKGIIGASLWFSALSL